MSVKEIPLTGSNQAFPIQINGNIYNFRLIFCQTQDQNACWLLDIADSNGNPLVTGIPLVTGCDLLGQYQYLGLGVIMWCATPGSGIIPDFGTLGSLSHLYYETYADAFA